MSLKTTASSTWEDEEVVFGWREVGEGRPNQTVVRRDMVVTFFWERPCGRGFFEGFSGLVAGFGEEFRRPVVGRDSRFWSSCRLVSRPPKNAAGKEDRNNSSTLAAADVRKNVSTT